MYQYPVAPLSAPSQGPLHRTGDKLDMSLIRREDVNSLMQRVATPSSPNMALGRLNGGEAGTQFSSSELARPGGPFYPEVYEWKDSVWDDDQIVIGKTAETWDAYDDHSPQLYAGRSDVLPAIILVNGCAGYSEQGCVKNLWTLGSGNYFAGLTVPSWAPADYETDDRGYRVLCIEVTTVLLTKRLSAQYVYLTMADVLFGLSDWKRAGLYYFPLGWIHVDKVTLAEITYSGAGRSVTNHVVKRVTDIQWPFTGPIINIGGTSTSIVPIKIASGGAGGPTGHLADVYAKGYDEPPTATDVHVRFENLSPPVELGVGTPLSAFVINEDYSGTPTDVYYSDVKTPY